MWPDRVSNPGPLTYESGALPTALRSPAFSNDLDKLNFTFKAPKTQTTIITAPKCQKNVSSKLYHIIRTQRLKANSENPDEVAHNEPPHLGFHCFKFNYFFVLALKVLLLTRTFICFCV